MASQDLGTRRVRLVLAALDAEHGHGWQTQLARDTGIHQTTWSKIAKEERGAGRDVITALCNTLSIDPRFFTDPALGDEPDYRRFVGRTVERDDTKGVPSVEGWLAMEAAAGRVVEPELVEHLRSFRFRTGDIPLEDVLALARSWRARQDERRVVERPALETKVEEARGQKRLAPLRKRGGVR